MNKYKVVILQHRLLHYREGLFTLLKEECKKSDIDLMLVHGSATKRELPKKDEGYLPWAIKIKNLVFPTKNVDIIYQKLPVEVKQADLVIMMQENRILSNYPILLSRLWCKRKVAFWGHGKNYQSGRGFSLKEKWKQLYINYVDWWFAYTGSTVGILLSSGYPSSRITNLENAIDTTSFKNDLASCSIEDLSLLRGNLSVPANAQVGLYCGSIYKEKKVDLLAEAVLKIKKELPNFHLIVIGDGPDMPLLQELLGNKPWVHLVGVKHGKEKAMYFKLADVMLNPGLVGLHIVDAFCAELVMVTTQGALHSPEIDYLENGINGLITRDGVDDYASAVISLFSEPAKLSDMQHKAFEASERYTLENMVSNFMKGIKLALESQVK